MRLPLIAGCMIALAACGEDRTSESAPASGDGTQAVVQAGSDQPIAPLGLTSNQLDDAEILDQAGVEIADVERVVVDSSGQVTGLIVEVEDSDPDRFVTIPLDGLTKVEEGDDVDLRSSLTREALMAMPESSR